VRADATLERLDFFFFFFAAAGSEVLGVVPSVCWICSVPDSFSDSDSMAACSGAPTGWDSAMLGEVLKKSDLFFWHVAVTPRCPQVAVCRCVSFERVYKQRLFA